MAVAPSGEIYIARQDVLLRIDPGTGETERLDFAARPDRITALAFPSTAGVLVGTDSSGVHLMDGAGWHRINDGIESRHTSALFAARGRAWAGTANAGLFLADIASGVAQRRMAAGGLDISVRMHSRRVTITSSSRQPLTIAILDVRGRIVVAGSGMSEHASGQHAEIDLSSLAAGAYLVRLESDSHVVVRRILIAW